MIKAIAKPVPTPVANRLPRYASVPLRNEYEGIMAPRISVAFPTFNRLPWLKAALASILEPGLDCEVVVIDNGSSDGTWDYLAGLAARERRLKPVRWERNIGIDGYPSSLLECSGTYVAFFADDDEMLPGGLARKADYLDAHPEVGMVFTPVRWMDAEGNDRGELEWGRLAEDDVPGDSAFFEKLIQGNLVPMGAALFRRSLSGHAEAMRNAAYAPSGDWLFWLGLARKASVAFLREPSVRLRMHGGQATQDHGIRAGGFVDANLNVWRHWMLDADPPFVPTEEVWSEIVNRYAGVLKASYGNNVVRFVEGIHRLKAVKVAQDYVLKPRASSEARAAFLYEPDWTRSEWVEVVLSHLEAFAPGEPVSLLLLLGEGGEKEAATQAVLQVAAATGREQFPEIVMVEGPVEFAESIKRFTSIQRIPAGGIGPDALQGPLGERMLDAHRRLTRKG